ncbi:putative photosynthetic complex assembly protein PuhE [Sphingomonas sp. 1P06PA]|uniref:putative photosynthetic complex assembly protein PuhE n=1 Tax=Sphingomonas sp. 1P06PA TaxID=554121 RepID=UPI0039A4E77B
MAEHGLPLLFVVAMWFGTTGLVVWLDSRPASTFGRSLGAAGLVAIAAIVAVALSVRAEGAAAAYLGLGAALAIWGWHEISFLTGIVTGPRRAACPPDARGWDRFRLAAATLIHHELALAATLIVLAAISWGHANPTAALAFALLFALRISAKLNIFLGVPNFADELMPQHLAYLRSYFRKAGMNPLFPLSMAAAAAAAIWFGQAALAAEGGRAVANSLLFAIAALGAIEHLFMMIPFRDGALWRWASRSSIASE